MLGEIKKDFEWGIKVGGNGNGYSNLDDEQVEWLINRVEYLERLEKYICKVAGTSVLEDVKNAMNENKFD